MCCCNKKLGSVERGERERESEARVARVYANWASRFLIFCCMLYDYGCLLSNIYVCTYVRNVGRLFKLWSVICVITLAIFAISEYKFCSMHVQEFGLSSLVLVFFVLFMFIVNVMFWL